MINYTLVNNTDDKQCLWIELHRDSIAPRVKSTNPLGPWYAKRDEPQCIWRGSASDSKITMYVFTTEKPRHPSQYKIDLHKSHNELIIIEGTRNALEVTVQHGHGPDDFSHPKPPPTWMRIAQWIFWVLGCVAVIGLVSYFVVKKHFFSDDGANDLYDFEEYGG